MYYIKFVNNFYNRFYRKYYVEKYYVLKKSGNLRY